MSEPGSNRFPATQGGGNADKAVPQCAFVLSTICIDGIVQELSPATIHFVEGVARMRVGPAALHVALNTSTSRYSVREEDYGRLLRRLLCTAPSPLRPVVEDTHLTLRDLTTL